MFDDDPNRGVVGVVRDFKPPETPPPFTGLLWKNKNGTVGLTVTDVFGWPIHLIGTLEPGGVYYLRGWRGVVPDAIRIAGLDPPLSDGEPVTEAEE